ncbi:hypothetical protein JT359_10735, partial [Candidatus Poribacteria bacterium]|nr:hypothetical protein [Candidatus Poribacteria bacterium]
MQHLICTMCLAPKVKGRQEPQTGDTEFERRTSYIRLKDMKKEIRKPYLFEKFEQLKKLLKIIQQ